MVLWIILGMGWLAILFAGITLFRLADYADKKVRRLARASAATQKTSCLSIAHHKFLQVRSTPDLSPYLLRCNDPKRRNCLEERRICNQGQGAIGRLDAKGRDAGRSEVGDVEKSVRDVHSQEYWLRRSNGSGWLHQKRRAGNLSKRPGSRLESGNIVRSLVGGIYEG